jgi:glucose/mannose transport system substrate-binding protein
VQQIAIESWWTTGPEAMGLQKLLDKFNADNPTLCAYNALTGVTGTVLQDRVKLEVLGGTPPDTFQIRAGHELLDQYVNVPAPGPYVAPLGKNILNAADLPPGIVKIIAGQDGRPYSVPLGVHRTNVLWYSKAAFKKAGIAGPPTTWAEFKTDAEALRAAGITPLAVGDSDIWATGMIFETALIGELGADGFEGLWTGATRWDDARVLRAANDLKMALSFENPDHASLSWDQAVDMLTYDSAAMTIMGDWADTEFLAMGCADYGWAPTPGSAGIFQITADSFPLPVNAPDPDATKKLLAYMSTAEAQDLFNPSNGSIPSSLRAGHTLAGVQPYTVYQQSTFSQWVDPGLRIVPSMERGAAAGPAWVSAIEAALTAYETDMNQGALIRSLVGAAGRFVTGP